MFPGGDRGHEQHNSLLESFCWNLPFLSGTLTGLHKGMTLSHKNCEKLQAEQIKISVLHSFQDLAGSDNTVFHPQPCNHSPAATAPAPGKPWEAADTRQDPLF